MKNTNTDGWQIEGKICANGRKNVTNASKGSLNCLSRNILNEIKEIEMV